MAKLITKELEKDDTEPASKLPKTSTTSQAEFWMTASKNLHKLVGETFRSAEQLLAQQAPETAAWQGTFTEGAPATEAESMVAYSACSAVRATSRCTSSLSWQSNLVASNHSLPAHSAVEAACPQTSGSSFSSYERSMRSFQLPAFRHFAFSSALSPELPLRHFAWKNSFRKSTRIASEQLSL